MNVFFSCGYFVLLNGPNWGVLCIIPVFGVICCQNLGIWSPVAPIYRINPTVLRLILKKYNHILCPVCIFLVTFYDQMVQIVKLFAYNQYLGSSLFKNWVFDPLGSQNIGLPPLFSNLLWRNTIMCCSECIFVVTFYYQMGQIWELFAYYLYLGSYFVKFWVFDPLGCPYIGLPSTVLQLILKKYHHTLSWMYFCGYLAWSNGSNCEVICITSIFGVIFGSKFGFLTIGVPKYRATPLFSN